MATQQELTTAVQRVFEGPWDSGTKGTTVPDPESLRLNSNHGIKLDATVLYADMKDSTGLVDGRSPEFAAGIYKAYLRCAALVIKSEGGVITAYDGDRVMAVFLGDAKNTSAVRTGLKINNAVDKIIQPLVNAQYPNARYKVGHTIGIDTSEIMASRIGVRNDNDIVWVGSAANHAAKLCALNYGQTIRITAPVFHAMHRSVKTYKEEGMWNYEVLSGDYRGGIYSSCWWFAQSFQGDGL